FFQAEDGIRDRNVTGVQTCALPISGLFGIGGGTISVPAMILFFGIPVQVAIGTSMFMIFFISLISSSTHIFLGHIAWKYVIFFIIGSYLGGTAGARMSKWFK